MATNQTTNYQLNQWKPTDQILRTDFNADNAKLDAALTDRNCCFYTAAYVGNGNSSRTHIFPRKPAFVVIMGNGCLMLLNRASNKAHMVYNILAQRNPTLTWSGNTVTVDIGTDSVIYAANVEDITYAVFAILELE